jgi:hypothetical protein
MKRWMREDPLNISLVAGEMSNAARGIGPIMSDNMKPADIIAILMLSSQIDGWNWRRALVDAQDIATDVALRLQQEA